MADPGRTSTRLFEFLVKSDYRREFDRLLKAIETEIDDFTPSDPYASDGASAPVSTSATGIYTDGTFTYSSTIDSSVTGLYARHSRDNGVSAAGRLPILVLMHGYAGDANSFDSSDLHRFASYGFFVLVLGLRAKNGALGATDASGREIHDILDALAVVRADGTLGPLVDLTKTAIVGYSGGGGNALACMTKCPDYFNVAVSMFGISDYGYRPTTSWYDFGQLSLNPTSKSYLDVDVGVRTAASDPYLARMASATLATTLEYGGFVELFHDTGDTAVSVESSRQVVSELSAAGLTSLNYKYNESTVSSPTRWLHGHPQDHLPQMIAAEWIFGRRCRNSPVWSMPVTGKVRVNGWFRSRGQDFDIWLGDAPGPKTNGTGGRNKVADVEYDIINGTFRITPITMAGTMYVIVRMGVATKTLNITDPTRPSLIEFYGTASSGYRVILDASTMVFSDGDVVTTAADSSGNGNDFAMTGSPVYKTTGLAGGPSIRFSGSGQYGVCPVPIMNGTTTGFSVAIVAAFTSITGNRVAFVFGSNTSDGFGLGVNLSGASKFQIVQPTVQFNEGGVADTSPHLHIFSWSGTAWTYYLDGTLTALSSPAVAAHDPTARVVLGAYSAAGAFPFQGDIGLLEATPGVWTTLQRDAIRAYAKGIWTGLP